VITVILQVAFTFAVARTLIWLVFDRPLRRRLDKLEDRLRLLQAFSNLTDEERDKRLREPFGRSEDE
jgi:hypothetical protein